MVREELINSAISFLQDPSVASAPLDKRIAFLQSKNLTQDEINIALARTGATGSVPPTGPVGPTAPYGYGQPPPGYGPYPGYWQQPPPEVPRRDWRDWFIMATVMGGVGFGLYVTAKRYVLPLIKPPTPEQITQDKEAIDASFNKAFATLEALETDTKVLKEAEQSRTTRLDAALSELESALTSLKEADRQRDTNVRQNADELRSLRDLIPKAIDAHKQATEQRIKDLATEVRSLKTLISNRMGTGTALQPGVGSVHKPNGLVGVINGTGAASPTVAAASETATEKPAMTDSATSTTEAANGTKTTSTTTTPTTNPASVLPGGYASRFGTGRTAQIPAWQMAAAKKSSDNLKDGTATASSSNPPTPTVTEEASTSSAA